MTDVLNYDITLHRGEDWSETMTLYDDNDQPVDMTGWTAALQVRQNYAAATLLSLSSSVLGGGITIDPANGAIGLSLSGSACGALEFERGVYDLKVNTGAETHYLLRGDFVINPRVTT